MTRLCRSTLNVSVILALLNPLPLLGADLPVPCAAGACGAGNPDVFVTSGQASYGVAGNVGTIEQLSDRAILNWQQFDVADGSKVVFKQPRDISVALNRIYDQSPSKILGAVTANGQIYLINPNGMIFGENARVNVNTLLASSLDVPESVFNGPGLAGAINEAGGVAALSAATGPRGDIDVESGAVLDTVDGGRVFIFAPKIVNEGTIVTPGGQTILAASHDKVYLEFSTDPTVRGFLVEVGTGGEAINLGEIIAERGNITMAGLLVRQQGVVSATTSVDENGSIRLLARDRAIVENVAGVNRLLPKRGGTLVLGADSTTSVLPDQELTKTGIDAQVQQPSTIELMGREVRIESNARVVATGGRIAATATERPDIPLDRGTVKNGSSLVVEDGAVIDVSGDDTTVLAMSRNQVDLDLRSNELADSPLQRGGALQGQTVSVDARKGTTVANAQRAIDNIARPISERLSAGGTVSLRSEGTIDLQQGSTVDVSGGQVRFESGVISTTKLTSAGKVYDIATADPNRTYDGVFSGITVAHPDWGVTENFVDTTGTANSQYEQGYVEGKDAGRLDIVAHEVALDGTVNAGAIAGPNQRLPTESLGAADRIDRPYSQLPQRGQIGLTLNPQFDTVVDVTLGAVSLFQTPGAALIRPEWIVDSQLGALSISTYGAFVYADDAAVSLFGGSSLAVSAGRIQFDGQLAAASGTLKLRTTDRFGGNAPIQFGARSRVNLAGLWVNDDPLTAALLRDPVWIDGGTIDVLATGDFLMQPGAWLDVSGGAWLAGDGTLFDGRGGLISLGTRAPFDTRFVPQGGLAAFALHQGGTLRFEANALALYEAPADLFIAPIVIFPPPTDPAPPADQLPFPELPFFAKIDAAVPSFFLDYRGFENFAFVGNRYGVVVNDNALIAPRQRNYQLPDDLGSVPSGGHLADFATIVSLPEQERRPVNLTLGYERQLGTTGSESVVVQPGARIELDIGGALNVYSEGSIWIRGSLAAPAGSIDLSLRAPKIGDLPYIKNQVLWVADGASVATPGAFVPSFNALGLRTGNVLAGGAITLDAVHGFIVTEQGSSFDIGGIARQLDITRTTAGLVEPVWVASDAGTLDITTAEGALLAGSVNALNERPDSRGEVRGGTLNVSIDPNRRRLPPGQSDLPVGERFPDQERILRVTDAVAVPPFAFGDVIPQSLLGQAQIDLNEIAGTGIDTIALGARNLQAISGVTNGAGGRIRFESDLTFDLARALVLDAPNVEVAADRDVELSAPYVRLGYDFVYPRATGNPFAGTGALSLTARTVDLLGNVQIDGTSRVAIASSNDIRMIGTLPDFTTRVYAGSLETQGDLTLAAARIYPTTLTHYTIEVLGGRLAIEARDAPASRLFSAAGSLALLAPDIDVGGRLYAPQGQLSLTAGNSLVLREGSVLSTALLDDVTLFGQTQAGLDWVYPFPNNRLQIIDEIPGKSISLTAAEVITDAGSVVDLSGGGTLEAFEFIAGPGGSRDYLSAGNVGDSFVILPVDGPHATPYEPLASAGFLYGSDTGVHLDGMAGVPAGEYAVLPARFALLPGALLVTPQPALLDMVPGEVRYDVDGAPIVAGRFTVRGTPMGDSRWSGFKIQPGDFAQQRSEYVLTDANAFFEGRGGRLPRDGGSVAIVAQRGLSLDGEVTAPAAAGGRLGTADLVADRLAVIASGSQALDGFVNLTDAQLRGLDVGSIVLGASRVTSADGMRLDVQAADVTIGAGARISGPEIILAGRAVNVAALAQIDAASSDEQRDTSRATITASDGAAVLVATSRDLDAVAVRPGAAGSGTLRIDAGARIGADGTLIVEAPGNAVLDGDLAVLRGTFILGSGVIALGNTDATDATVLDDRLLNGLGAAQLTLTSRSGTAVYGTVGLTADQISLGGPVIYSATDGASLNVTAQTITIENSSGGAAGGGAATGGSAVLAAEEISVGGGNMRFAGFDTLALAATTRVIGNGSSSLITDGALTLTTPVLTAASGADLTLQAGGALNVQRGTSTPPPTTAAPPPLGGAVRLRGDSIAVASRVVASSGVIDLTAANDVTVDAGGALDASGSQVTIGTSSVASAGGRIALASTNGDVAVNDGGSLTVAPGGDGARGGRVEMRAPTGTVTVDGALAGGPQAQFALDAGAAGDFERVNAAIEQGQFDGERDYRLRTGDVVIGAGGAATAERVSLVADTGAIVVDGTVNLGGDAPEARLSAGRDVTISGAILADSAAKVTLAAAASNGIIAIEASGRVALSGGDLVARVISSVDVGSRVRLDGDIDTGRTILDLVHTVDVVDGVFDAADQAMLAEDLTARFSDLEPIRALLPDDALIASSVELRSMGTLRLTDAWDLLAWRYADLPGTLTLRSGGDLALNADLSDGFGVQLIDSGGGQFPVLRPLVGPSWNYSFVAGSDLTSADVYSVNGGTGSVRIGGAVTVRTGTGDVAIRAGNSLVFNSGDSSLYTAGETTGTGGFSDVFAAALMHDAQFPQHGGDIDIRTGGSIVGAKSQQLITPYMARFGGEFYNTRMPAVVGVAFDNFGVRTIQQNIGSFGGGAVRIIAGGEIRDLSVVVPDTLQHAGDAQDSLGQSSFDVTFSDNSYLRRGTTTLDVASRGDIVGGLFYLGSGAATVSSEGSIAPTDTGLGALLASSDASFDVTARRDLFIESMFNPTMLPQSPNLQAAEESSYFFTYTQRARLAVTSYGGDVAFGNDVRKIRTSFDFPSELRADRALDVYPSTVIATALTGDVDLRGGMTLYPGPGGFQLYAAENVTGPTIAPGTLFLSDADPALLPNPDRPAADLIETELRLPRGGQGDSALLHASVPVHSGDTTPSVIVAQRGSIDAPLLNVVSSESLRIAALDDVNLGRVDAQNISAADITSVVSGGDIRIRSNRNAETGQVITNSRAISVGGPGEVQLVAGRSIDLGSSIGIETTGDLDNPALADEGANVAVLAGNAGVPDVDAFVQRYFVDGSGYDEQLMEFASTVSGAPVTSPDEALVIFIAQPRNVQQTLILDVFFAELKSSGIAAAQVIAAKGSTDEVDAAYAPGKLAITTLFPDGRDFSGDLSLFFSRITTLDGGDIRLVVPGGIVNAGLATSSLSTKGPSELGIVAQRAGGIDLYAGGDVQVNQSRVFTLSGGDINIWSQTGDVDAGRGAKSALATPGLSAVLGENDSVQRIVPPSISGSGIAAAAGANGELPDIVLSTPNGIVDAGDAGIRTPGRLFTATNDFLGRDNVEVGSFVGAPVGAVTLSADLASVGDSAASASQDLAQAAVDDRQAQQGMNDSMSQSALGWLEVFLEGYGDPDAECDPDRDPSCRAKIQ